MLPRFVPNERTRTQSHLFIGVVFFLLSTGIFVGISPYLWNSVSVLGTQTGIGSGSGISAPGGQDGGTGGTAPTSVPQDGGSSGGSQTQPTSIPLAQPTATPVPLQPTSVPAPTQVPSQTDFPHLVEGGVPQTEIVIKNVDNSLVITSPSNPNEIVRIEPGEALVGQPGTVPTAITVPAADLPTTADATQPRSFFNVADIPHLTQNSPGTTSAPMSETVSTPNALESIRDFIFRPGNKDGDIVPAYTVAISAHADVNTWLSQYQFQVWPLGSTHLVLYRNNIMTITRFPVIMCLSRLCLKVQTEDGVHHQIIYYPDLVWQYLSSLNLIDEDSHVDPIILTQENNEIVYKTEGMSSQFLFAAIPVKICKRISISAENEEIKSYESCSVLDTVLDYLSLRAGRGT